MHKTYFFCLQFPFFIWFNPLVDMIGGKKPGDRKWVQFRVGAIPSKPTNRTLACLDYNFGFICRFLTKCHKDYYKDLNKPKYLAETNLYWLTLALFKFSYETNKYLALAKINVKIMTDLKQNYTLLRSNVYLLEIFILTTCW